MAIWKDRSKSWSDDTIVSSETKVGGFKLSITRHIHYQPDDWIANCSYIFSRILLKNKDINLAKAEAEQKLKLILEEALKDLS